MDETYKYGFQNKNQLRQSLLTTEIESETIEKLLELSKNCIWLETHSVAVSYTHLDVYKRQDRQPSS